MSDKLKDFLHECMSSTKVEATREQFQQAFCSRCLNPDCHRSSFQGMRWNHRMKRQLQGLNNPIFMPEDDPRFDIIANQDFESFEHQTAHVQKDWKSFEGEEKTVHRGSTPTLIKDSDRVEETMESLQRVTRGEEPKEAAPEEPQEQETPAPVQPEGPPAYNTPAPRRGVMLEGAARKAEPKKVENAEIVKDDPWAVPSDPSKTKKKKGRSKLRVRLGGDKEK